MNIRTLVSILLLSVLFPPPAARAVLGPASPNVVHATIHPSYNPAAPGLDIWVALEVKVDAGWHVTAPLGVPETMVPMSLMNPSAQPIKSTQYPQGVLKALAGSDTPYSVYENAVTLYAPLKIPADAPTGSVTFLWGLQVQACDDRVCLSPGILQIAIPVNVDLPAKAKPSELDWFKNLQGSTDAPPVEENLIQSLLRQKGWWLTFLLIFLGGLALNLTPCVYPMIPLTVAYFGSREENRKGVLFLRAVAYVVGISVTYTALGVTAALTGRLFGSALQSPYVLIGISAVLAGLSLSMFGLYEIQAPSWLLNRIGGSRASGTWGAFLMGLVFGIVAAPCVDPFSIGLLTYVASKADPMLGFAMFFTLSVGLGLPYLALGFVSGRISVLPKSGVWMMWVKKVFGFVLLGMPLYFLKSLLPPGALGWILGSYLIVAGFLLGFVFGKDVKSRPFTAFRNLLGSLVIAFGVSCFMLMGPTSQTFFEPYSAQRFEKALADRQPILLDFSADWCIPCKELERTVFVDSRVVSELKNWAVLKVDLTRFGDPSVSSVRQAWGVEGVPTIILIGRNGKEMPLGRLVGTFPSHRLLNLLAKER